MLSVTNKAIMLSIIMPSAVLLNVILLIIVAPIFFLYTSHFQKGEKHIKSQFQGQYFKTFLLA